MAVPRTNPATSLPPLITSNMAYSSATRSGGLYRFRLFPRTTSFAREVLRARAAAMRFGEGIRP